MDGENYITIIFIICTLHPPDNIMSIKLRGMRSIGLVVFVGVIRRA
jgi:hypothetical protein